MKLLSQYRSIVMSSSEGEHYKTSPLKSHSNTADLESTMLQPATPSSSNRNDFDTVKVLNIDPVKDSKQRAADSTVDVLSADIAPNTATVPMKNVDATTSSNAIEETTAMVNNESSTATTTATSSDGNSEIALTFPQRLMEMLDDPQNAEMMAWLPHGRAFAIYRKREFATDVLPKYFQKAAKYSSFTRKLNRWGFIRVTRGPETGAYYHQLFRRNERRLVLQMTCHTAATNSNNSGNNPNASNVLSMVPKTSKGGSGMTHGSENESLTMMMMYPNYIDPATSQYMYNPHNPYGGGGPHLPQYPSMGPQQQYYGTHNAPMPYNMYEEPVIDRMASDESQYYPHPPPTMGGGGLYLNHHYGVMPSTQQQPPPHGSYMEEYSQGRPSHHDHITTSSKHSRHDSVLPISRPQYHDDTVGPPPRRMSGMTERVENTTRADNADEEMRAPTAYSGNEGKEEYNNRMMKEGTSSSSFQPATRHDYPVDYQQRHPDYQQHHPNYPPPYHHHHHHSYYPPVGYNSGNNEEDITAQQYHPPP